MRHLNFLYLLGHLNASKWDNNEIRYSLRSIEQTFPVGWVGIVGPAVPPFLHGIEHIKVAVPPFNKFQNLIRQLHVAANTESVPEDLILMNDDFIVRSTPPWDWTPTYMGVIDEQRKGNKWVQTIQATAQWLREQGIEGPHYSYEGHTPMPFNKSRAAEVLGKMVRDERLLQFRTAYGNYWRIGGVQHINAKHKTLAQWPDNSPFLSLKPNPVPEIKKFLAEWLTRPSRFEQGGSDNGIQPEGSQPNP